MAEITQGMYINEIIMYLTIHVTTEKLNILPKFNILFDF